MFAFVIWIAGSSTDTYGRLFSRPRRTNEHTARWNSFDFTRKMLPQDSAPVIENIWKTENHLPRKSIYEFMWHVVWALYDAKVEKEEKKFRN